MVVGPDLRNQSSNQGQSSSQTWHYSLRSCVKFPWSLHRLERRREHPLDPSGRQRRETTKEHKRQRSTPAAPSRHICRITPSPSHFMNPQGTVGWLSSLKLSKKKAAPTLLKLDTNEPSSLSCQWWRTMIQPGGLPSIWRVHQTWNRFEYRKADCEGNWDEKTKRDSAQERHGYTILIIKSAGCRINGNHNS